MFILYLTSCVDVRNDNYIKHYVKNNYKNQSLVVHLIYTEKLDRYVTCASMRLQLAYMNF